MESNGALEVVVDRAVDHRTAWGIAHAMEVNRVATKVTLLTSTSHLHTRENGSRSLYSQG